MLQHSFTDCIVFPVVASPQKSTEDTRLEN